MKKRITSLLLACSLAISFPVFGEPAAEQGDYFIDPNIVGTERQILVEVMDSLDPEDRENVVYFDEEGKVYANRPELKEEWEEAASGDPEFSPTTNSSYIDSEDGSSIESMNNQTSLDAVMAAAPQYTCANDGGAYRRVWSKPGYSWYAGKVYLPSASEIKDGTAAGGNGQAVYIQTGGHALNGASEVDAGFLHGTTYGDWAPVLTVANQGKKFGARLGEGQTVYFKFYVPRDNEVAFFIQGKKKGASSVTTETIVQAARGWKSNGSGNVIKRTTSMTSTGSYNSGNFVRNVKWSDSYIGTSSTSNSKWLAAQSEGSCTVPNSNIVQVNYVNAGEETVNIFFNRP